jgi:DNA-binding IclR family transcriptional regulator
LKRLRVHLARVRADGYAVNNEEHISGVRGVAAPIFNHVGKVVASVGVCGSTVELPQKRVPKLGKELLSLAAALSRKFVGGIPLEV